MEFLTNDLDEYIIEGNLKIRKQVLRNVIVGDNQRFILLNERFKYKFSIIQIIQNTKY